MGKAEFDLPKWLNILRYLTIGVAVGAFLLLYIDEMLHIHILSYMYYHYSSVKLVQFICIGAYILGLTTISTWEELFRKIDQEKYTYQQLMSKGDSNEVKAQKVLKKSFAGLVSYAPVIISMILVVIGSLANVTYFILILIDGLLYPGHDGIYWGMFIMTIAVWLAEMIAVIGGIITLVIYAVVVAKGIEGVKVFKDLIQKENILASGIFYNIGSFFQLDDMESDKFKALDTYNNNKSV